MFLSDASIRRPVMMTMLIFSAVVIGLFSLTQLGIDIFPEIEFPFVTIVTVYPGAGPEEVETLITRPVEDAVAALSGLKTITSMAQEGMSLTFLEFDLDRDVDLAGIDVKEKVDAIRADLPEDALDPQIQKFDVNAIPIMNLAVSSPRPLDQLYVLTDEVIRNRLNRTEGLANVEIVGGKEREIQVAVDRRKLQARGMSILQVVQTLAQENMNLPSGHITGDRKEYSIRVQGEFSNLEQIAGLYLPSMGDGMPVRLADIARVEDTFAEQRELARIEGRESVGLSLIKRSDANAVQVGQAVKEELQSLRASLPSDVEITIARDRTEFIQDSVNDVRDNLIMGILLTALTLFLFLHSWKGTVIAALSMPVSIIATFTLLLFAGFTLNMMSLMALAISVGILVTNSIVVLENIERYRTLGHPIRESASIGTKEIALAVAAATMTNVVVFTPIAFMSGITGQFFKQFGLTVTFATLFSLLVSFTMVPMMASMRLGRGIYFFAAAITALLVYFSLGAGVFLVLVGFLVLIAVMTRTGWLARFFAAWDRFYAGLSVSYHDGLGFFLGRRWLLFGIVTVLFLSSFVVSGMFVGSEFFPKSDTGTFSMSVEMPPGATVAETDRMLRRIEDQLRQYPEVEKLYSQVGTSESGDFTVSQGVNLGVVVVELVDKELRDRSVYDIIDDFRPQLAAIPAAKLILTPGSFFGGGNESDLTIEVQGPDIEVLADLGDSVVAIAAQERGVIDPRSSWRTGQPELRLTPRRDFLADQNMSVAELGMAMRTMVEGQKVSTYREGNREYDIRVKLAEADLQNVEEVSDFTVMTMDGPQKLANVANVEFVEGPTQILRKDKQRMVQVTANLSGTTVGQVQGDIQEQLEQMDIPEGYSIRFAGQSEEMAESFGELGRALILAIILTYMLMAAMMESYVNPLIIMATLPLGLIGVLYALFLSGNSISIFSLMAVIMLVGIVVNNGILLIDYIETIRRERKDIGLLEAILEASPTRLRPIIMTNLATILGMTPLALGIGSGGEFRAPMAIAAIGGLITSTTFTLFLIPAMYYTVEQWKEKFRKPQPQEA
ncbi:MAG: efflux RND transporter permease subunit [Candidatus Zixiibacteriota bacterium]|nr:MAG: efflux RND transporter permease subunit [candidate division Zixibacteria bacterium]